MILGAPLFLSSFAVFQIPFKCMAVKFEMTRSFAIKTSAVISFLAGVRKRCYHRATKLLQLYILAFSGSFSFFWKVLESLSAIVTSALVCIVALFSSCLLTSFANSSPNPF